MKLIVPKYLYFSLGILSLRLSTGISLALHDIFAPFQVTRDVSIVQHPHFLCWKLLCLYPYHFSYYQGDFSPRRNQMLFRSLLFLVKFFVGLFSLHLLHHLLKKSSTPSYHCTVWVARSIRSNRALFLASLPCKKVRTIISRRTAQSTIALIHSRRLPYC